MAFYSYNQVAYRADFAAAESAALDGQKCDGDPGYDGDYWRIAAYLLKQKDAEIERLKCNLDTARHALRSLYAWHGTSKPMPQALRDSVLAVLGNNDQS